MGLFREAIMKNRWLWVHIIGGALVAKFFQYVYANQVILLIVLAGAIMWEILEFFISDVEKIYGSKRRFFLDALGDVFGAVLMALIVIF